MKSLKFLAISLLVALCLLIGFLAGLGYEKHEPKLSVIIDRVPAYKIQMEIKKQPIIINSGIELVVCSSFVEEWYQNYDTNISLGKDELPKRIENMKPKQESLEVFEQFFDNEEYEEEVLMSYSDYYYEDYNEQEYDYDQNYSWNWQEYEDSVEWGYEEQWTQVEEFIDQRPHTQSNSSIVDYASSWIGITPYLSWYDRDGNSLWTGTDCSGFVALVYDEFGYDLPYGSNDYQEMANISYDQLEAGDIIVYGYGSHVGIYTGNDTIIHCSNQEFDTIESDMWYREPTGYVHIGDIDG